LFNHFRYQWPSNNPKISIKKAVLEIRENYFDMLRGDEEVLRRGLEFFY